MQIGMFGLGRMGLNMSLRLVRGGHKVVAYDRTPSKVTSFKKEGEFGFGAASLQDLVGQLDSPRAVWLMLPAGGPTEEQIVSLASLLSPGDLIIDGGNSFYKDDIRRAQTLGKKGIGYLDAGVSGGIWGLQLGYCLMVGGEEEDFKRIEPALATLAPNREGYLHCGPSGAGHFIKMIHNGIEYGMMEAYGEGFEIIQASPYKQNLAKVSHLWNQGSVVRSWLLELAERAFSANSTLEGVSGYVEDSGEGRWTVQQAVESGVAAPVITLALYERFLSRQKEPLRNKILAALRNQFGGHAVVKEDQKPASQEAGAGAWRPATPAEDKRRR